MDGWRCMFYVRMNVNEWMGEEWRCMNYVRMNVNEWMGEDVWTM